MADLRGLPGRRARRLFIGLAIAAAALAYLAAACYAGPEEDLYAAIKADDAAKVRAALARLPGQVIRPPKGQRFGPVAFAAFLTRVEALRTLLAAGYPADEGNIFDTTPLFWADDAQVVDLLVASGASVNRLNAVGETALDNRPVTEQAGNIARYAALRERLGRAVEALKRHGARHSPGFGLVLADENGWTEYTKRADGSAPAFGNPVFVAKLKNFRPTPVKYVEVRCEWFDGDGRLVASAREVFRDVQPGEVRFIKLQEFGVPFPEKFSASVREVDSPF
jgi:hypothetical protein